MRKLVFSEENAGAIIRCQYCDGTARLIGSERHSACPTKLLTYFCTACDDYQVFPANTGGFATNGGKQSRHRFAATLTDHREYLSQVRARLKLSFESIERFKEQMAHPVGASGANGSRSSAPWNSQVHRFQIPESVASVFITDELARRQRSHSDYLQQTTVLKNLARDMVDRPDLVLPRLIDLAMEICDAVSGGISLYEADPAPGVFRWHHLRGTLEQFTGNAVPRDFSPCGIVLDEHAAMLVRRPERVYTWLQEADVSLPECLLVPLYVGDDDLLGTLWIVSESEEHFDAGHCETLSELAVFAGISLKLIMDRQSLKNALEHQETLTREMGHRVKNLFSIADSLVRMGARSGGTAKDLADRISGRLQALSIANSLVSTADGGGEERSDDLDHMIRTILSPYDQGRFEIDGPPLAVDPHSRNGIALIFHELATNAVKYGALCSEDGRVSVAWTTSNDMLLVHWREVGGPTISGIPSKSGFGGLLADKTVRAMDGTISYDWQPDGLVVTLTLPLSRVAQPFGSDKSGLAPAPMPHINST